MSSYYCNVFTVLVFSPMNYRSVRHFAKTYLADLKDEFSLSNYTYYQNQLS